MTKFPVPISSIIEYLPHRPPAVWVDEVTSANHDAGECRVILNPEASYFSNGVVRPSAFIEWMAQSYGYVLALTPRATVSRAFLVAVKGAEFAPTRLTTADLWVSIKVRRTHTAGPIVVVEAEAADSKGKFLAKAQLKLFAE